MHRSSTGILIVLAISLSASLTGCVGKNSGGSGGGGVKTVALSPSATQSINVGATAVFTATAIDASGRAVLDPIQFAVTSGNSNPAPLSVTSSGAVCAGSWDATGSICSPGVPGIALVRATVDGVSSAETTVYVHQHIDSIRVSRLDSQGPPQFDCFSQGQTWDYQAVAYDISQHDITNTVGPLSWSTSNANVLTVDSITGLRNNQIQVTAKNPGITQLFASVSGTTSTPLATPFTTCLVKYIRLHIEGSTGNSFTINNGGSKTIRATAVDTLGATLATPPLTWSSSNPEVANFSTAENTAGSNSATARSNQGSTDISAACTPPTCNIGVLPGLPVYASGGNLPTGDPGYGVITANITATKPPTYTAWAATTDCGTGLGCSSVTFAVTSGTTPLGASSTMSRTPNSMMFNEQGARIYFGSDQGLMYLDVGGTSTTLTPVSAAPTPCNVSLCGTVLAISPDGNRVVVADNQTVPHQVYIFNAASSSTAPIDLVLNCPASLGSNCTATATAAAFSPDEMKIFILGLATDQNGNLSNTLNVYSSVDAFQATALSTPVSPGSFLPAPDVAFTADGSFALVAGAPANGVSGFSTCDNAAIVDGSIVGLPGTPLRIVPIPGVQDAEIASDQSVVTENFLALDPPNVQTLTVQYTRDPLKDGQGVCNNVVPYSHPPQYPAPGFRAGTGINLGQGNFVPLYLRVVGNGSQAIVVGKNIPAVLLVDLNQKTTTPIALVNNGLPLAASASTDGSQVFVAACDAYSNDTPPKCTSGSVHIVNTLSGGDFQQVPYVNFNTDNSMCDSASAPPCFPNLIAIKPQ
ncbi:MAG: hypothetical protein LAO56_07780 [Acidobacteriia bacterium]|nr:hypothetical protein [Terriglobia bacterium]